MKKKVFSLMMTLLLAFIGVARADELTVNDGSNTNAYVPVYGFYADAYLKCEFVQPAADLAAMAGATINGVTFYAPISSASWGSANFQVFLTEVSSTSISDFYGPSTVVYEGALSISGGTMTINFTTPYTYNGGNLLVGVYNTETGSYVSCSWYGVSANGASVQGYSYSSLSDVTASQRNFLPKMTFDYSAGGGETVEVTIGDPTATNQSSYLPTYSLYEYSLTQQIYTADEIGVAGTINAFTMWLKNTSSYARNLNVYMKEVSVNAFASGSDWVSMSANDMVGTFTLANGISAFTETTVNLSAPFNYTGNGNLVICVQDVTGEWSSGASGRTLTANDDQALYHYHDGSVYNPSAPGVTGYTMTSKNVVRLNITTAGEGPIAINDIRIEGFTAPVQGQHPDFEVNVPEGAHYTLVETAWYSYLDPEERESRAAMTEEDTFDDPNMAYYMEILVEPEEGYVFNENATVYINNSQNDVDFDYTYVWEDGAYISSKEYHVYAEGLHTLAAYGDYNYIDQLVIERPNGAWMEPYHFNLYNDGDEDVEVVLIDFLHNNGYFSMVEETEYPFTVAANGRPGVDLYLNTNRDWTSTETIESLLAVNTTERSTHIYPIIAAPYTPYCPDVFEKAYDLGTVTEATQWREYMSTLWDGPAQQFQLHQNYDMPDFAANIPDGYDAVMKFKVDRAMSLNARVVEGYQNGKVALYTEDFYGEEGPMATNNYTERPMQGGGSTPAGGAFEAQIGDEASTSTFNYVPYYNYYYNSIGETLYTAAELQAAGVGRAPMTSLSWYASSVNGYESVGIQIWMANVTETALTTTSHLTSGMTKVFSGNITPVAGWNEFQFNQGSFAWDGTSNILICVLRNDTGWHSGLYWKAESSLGFNASAYDYDDYDAFNTTTNTYSLYTSTSRSIIKLKGGNRDNRDMLTYDFEGGLQGWTTIDADGDGRTWFYSMTHPVYDQTGKGHNGTDGFAISASYEDYGGGAFDANNYLVAPQMVSIQNGSSIEFWADYGNDGYPDYFEVCVATAANPTAADFTMVWGGNAKNLSSEKTAVRYNGERAGNWRNHVVDLSAYAGQNVWIAFHHEDYDEYEVYIDDVTINAASSTPVDPVDPVDPSTNPLANFSAGPVIENLNILPGTYYLVASSTDRDYEVEIGIEDLPCPQKAVVVAPIDNAEGIQPNSVTLKWLLDPNCTEYRLTFSTTYWPDDEVETHPQTILVDWTNDLAEEYTVTNLWNNTNYFWRVDQRTNGGEPVGCTTIGDIWGFTTHFNVPQNLTATPVELFEGQTTTLNWNSIVDRTYRYYYIYKDDEYLDRTTVNQVNMTTYTVAATELPYNMDGYKFNVTAIYDEGESDFSNDAIVKVSGYTNETGINGYVYEQDEVTPIGGVTVTITGTDEFNHEHTYTATTDENGYYHVQVYVGHYTVAVANKEGYQEATTTHALPFDAPHQGQVNDVNFIMDEVFYAPANVCAETVEVEGEELVKIWWDFNFYNEMVEDFETGDLSQFDWETTATYPWTITTTNPYEGTYCLKSGGAGVNNVVSDLNLTVEIPNDGILSFFIKPSCENNWDFGHFYLDGTEMSTFTGAGNWGEKRYPITEGEHTLRWSYTKDNSVNSNDDCVYLDYIRFNLLPEPPIAGDTYDFEDGMQGWTTIDADGDGYNWNMASNVMSGAAGHDGSADFVFSQSYDNNYGVLYPDNYFVSPQVQLGGQLRFYACAQDASYAAEHFGVAVSTTGNTSASAFTMVQEWTMSAKGDNNGKPVALNTRSGRAQGTWYEFNVDLSAYAGQTGYIALRHFNCSDMFYLDVDDITIADPNRGVAEVEMNRSLNHFNIYRTDCYNDGPYNSDNTEFLSTVWLPDTAYFDVSWVDAAPGVYKWGVSAVYAGNQADNPNNPRIDYPFEERESEITWHTGCSPCIDKDMYILDGVTINVVLNSADSPEGTVVTFENTNPGEQALHPMEPLVLDQTGYYVFPEFRKGNYNITIEHDGYFTMMDYQEIWTPMDLRYVLIEKIFNARDLYVSRTGWAMWAPNGTLSNPEDDPMRHLEGYKVMCTSIDGEPIYNVNTPVERPFCQLATDELIEGDHYICRVAAIYSTGMSDFIEAEWQYEPCEHYAGVVDGVVNVEGSTISWEYPGVGPTPPPAGDNSFTEGFEGGLNGWNVLTVNADGGSWVHSDNNPGAYEYGEHAHGGTGFAMCYSFIDYDGAYNTDSYLYTPQQYSIVNGSTLTFWADNANDSYPESFSVCVATAANPTASDFTQVWNGSAKGVNNAKANYRHETNRYDNWRQHTVDLSAYAGQNVWIAFRDVNYDMYEIWIDDVALTAGAKSAPASLSSIALSGQAGNFSNRDGWLTYDQTGIFQGAFGFNGNLFKMGALYPASTMAAYDGQTMTKVSFPAYHSVTGTIEIYQGGTTEPGTLVYSQDFTMTGDDWEQDAAADYNDITLTTPVTIDGSQSLWIVVGSSNYTDYPFCVNSSETYANYQYAYLDGYGWYLISEVGGYGTWMLRAYVEEGTTPVDPDPEVGEGILGAMIFVDGEWEAFVEYPTNSYTYEGEGENVCVRIVYDGANELPDNNYYYAMSCGDCVEVNGEEPIEDVCAPVTNLVGQYMNNEGMEGLYVDWEDPEGATAIRLYADGELIGELPVGQHPIFLGFDGQVPEHTFMIGAQAIHPDCESEIVEVEIYYDDVIENEANVALFPNPTKGNVTIQAKDMNRITVVSVLGQVVFDTELDQDEYILNMAQFNTGLYMVRIYTDGGVTVKRVTVMH